VTALGKGSPMELYYGPPRPVDFATVLYQSPDREFRKPSRPAVALLDFWGRDPEAALARVCGHLNIDPPAGGKVCFRYPVAVLPAVKPSFTDVMGLVPNFVIGVEGRSGKGLGRTVGEWLRRGGDDTGLRDKVLDLWLDRIHGTRAAEVDRARLPDVAYRLLRHTAAVCAAEPGKRVRRRVVLYQLFLIESKCGESKARKRVDALRMALQTWADALRPKDALQLWLHALRLRATAHLIRVRNDLRAAKSKGRPDLLRRALFDSALYDVAGQTAERITPAAP
jgi:hypothetical protein